MDEKVISIDLEVAAEARKQADFLLTELKRINTGYEFPKELLDGTYPMLYSAKLAAKKMKQK